MIQLSDASSKTEHEGERQADRARLARLARPSGDVKIAMNTRLSMPRTISSAVSVSSAPRHSDRHKASMSAPPRQHADAEEIDGDRDERPGHVRPGSRSKTTQ